VYSGSNLLPFRLRERESWGQSLQGVELATHFNEKIPILSFANRKAAGVEEFNRMETGESLRGPKEAGEISFLGGKRWASLREKEELSSSGLGDGMRGRKSLRATRARLEQWLKSGRD